MLLTAFSPHLKRCVCCGHLKEELTLTDRTYVCKKCGMVKDRAVNAAINLDTGGRAHPEPTDACGQDGSVSCSP
ncbi:MAG: transposase [bacterium]|nr:transposase [bacterium]